MAPGEWAGLFIRNSQAERRVSSSTLEAYTLDLAMASRWAVEQQTDLVGLTTADLKRYVAERARQGTLPSTIARQMSSLRRFYSFLVVQGVIAANPAAAVILAKAARQQPGLVGDA
jgi:site-specific recombinase XerD